MSILPGMTIMAERVGQTDEANDEDATLYIYLYILVSIFSFMMTEALLRQLKHLMSNFTTRFILMRY